MMVKYKYTKKLDLNSCDPEFNHSIREALESGSKEKLYKHLYNYDDLKLKDSEVIEEAYLDDNDQLVVNSAIYEDYFTNKE